jgi:hypothetical protein
MALARTSAAVQRLRMHVHALADTIGERHVGRPEALHAVALYIRRALDEAGCTVRLVAFVNEEPPLFFTRRTGSAVYARAVIAFVSNLRSRRALRGLVQAFHSVSDFPAERLASPDIVPVVVWSDQLSLWRAWSTA